MNYNELYKQRILELLKLCTDIETENEMLLKQIGEQSVKIKEMENTISKFENKYLIPVYDSHIKVNFVPYTSDMASIS